MTRRQYCHAHTPNGTDTPASARPSHRPPVEACVCPNQTLTISPDHPNATSNSATDANNAFSRDVTPKTSGIARADCANASTPTHRRHRRDG